jgi:hypothetical protein
MALKWVRPVPANAGNGVIAKNCRNSEVARVTPGFVCGIRKLHRRENYKLPYKIPLRSINHTPFPDCTRLAVNSAGDTFSEALWEYGGAPFTDPLKPTAEKLPMSQNPIPARTPATPPGTALEQSALRGWNPT